jgi:ATP-dependent DNA helicase RecG
MADLADILDKLRRPLAVENRMGCTNLSVIGGLDRYMQNWARRGQEVAEQEEIRAQMAQLQDLFADYARNDPRLRQRKLRFAKRLLDQLAEDVAQGRPPRVAPSIELQPVALPSSRRAVPGGPAPAGVSTSPSSRWRPGLDSEVKYLKGVGPKRAELLAKLGIRTIGDLFYYYPIRPEDRSQLSFLGDAQEGVLQTFYGVVTGWREMQPRQGLHILKVRVEDGTGSAELTWFNQPYMKQKFEKGMPLIFSGKPKVDFGKVEISQPDWEPYSEEEGAPGGPPLHTGCIVPIYPLTAGLVQTSMRRLMRHLIDGYADQIEEVLPPEVLQAYQFPSRAEAIREMHFPSRWESRDRARRRLVFEEFFGLQVALALRRQEHQEGRPGIAFNPKAPLVERFLERLPFRLTAAQQRVIAEIQGDMAQPRPMNRLLQGDVGSGKTVVALVALLTALESGYQAAFMAPTEVLAEQQYRVIREWTEPLGVAAELLIGSLSAKAKRAAHERLARGETRLVVGTHALIQEEVQFHRLGLVVIDEQHRFGVMQRADLQQKGYNPDVLVMTATPIPRTLALTVYGDLDVSVLNELPPGRTPVRTQWFPLSARREVYRFIRQQLEEGRQAYIVCPLIEESEALEAQAATEEAARIQKEFPRFQVGLLHGRLSMEEKDAVMRAFRNGEIHLLTATTVIEVGIDVPNATVMLILNAERFGLAQLHQLRGRVGRGAGQSYCFLLTEAKYNPHQVEDVHHAVYREGRRRMQVMLETTDGFAIAEEDLLLRGPGEIAGTRQSGLPELHLADVVKDLDILEQARQTAFQFVARQPNLQAPEYAALKRYLDARFGPRVDLARVS